MHDLYIYPDFFVAPITGEKEASIPFRLLLLLCFRGGYRALSFSGKSFHLDAFNHVGNAAAEALNRTKNKIDYAITRNVLGASIAPNKCATTRTLYMAFLPNCKEGVSLLHHQNCILCIYGASFHPMSAFVSHHPIQFNQEFIQNMVFILNVLKIVPRCCCVLCCELLVMESIRSNLQYSNQSSCFSNG